QALVEAEGWLGARPGAGARRGRDVDATRRDRQRGVHPRRDPDRRGREGARMSTIEVMPIRAGDLTAEAHAADGRIVLSLRGSADMRAKDALDGFLARVHAEAQKMKVSAVVVDFQSLEFMNSSCFKGFITWITGVQELGPGRCYSIRFLSKPEVL